MSRSEPRALREQPILAGITAFLAVVTAVYWFTSYDDTGTVMLALSAATAGILAGYTIVAGRRAARARGPAGEADGMYLPHASVWPLAVGAGSVVVANGLALGLWALVPGGVILAAGLLGYARQSRHRR